MRRARLRFKQRNHCLQGFQSTAAVNDARWTTGAGFTPEEFTGAGPPCIAPIAGERTTGVCRRNKQFRKTTHGISGCPSGGIQHVGGSDFGMQIVTFEMLQQEEKNRQVARAVLAGVAGAANAYSASQAGHGSYTTPSGRTGTFYSPTAAVIAQNNAAVQNEAMFAASIETGQRNWPRLSRRSSRTTR